MDAEDNNEGSCHNSENEIDASLPAIPARRLSNLESLENAQNNQGSFVWSHFEKDENFKYNKRATCTYCSKTYICFGSSTTNITNHLKNVYSIQQETQSTGVNVLEMLKAPKWSYDHNEMINNLVKWIVIKQHAFTIAEEPEFINFIHSLHPTAKIPSANTIKSHISNFYRTDREKVQNILCFVHVINLSVQAALTQLESEISKLRDLVNRIRASSLRCEKLKMACKNNQLKDLTLIPDVPTRWNSIYEMISRSLQLKIAIDSVTLNDRDLKKYLLTENQWAELEKIKDFLFLFKEVTTIMSGFTYPTLSATIPLYNILIDHVENVIGDVNVIGDENEEVIEDVDDESEANSGNNNENEWSQIIKNAAKICRLKLLEYYNKTNYSYLISTILDPRLKLQYYKDNEWGDELINDIQQKFLSMYNKSYAVSIQSDQTETLNKEKSVMCIQTSSCGKFC
ncbi:unnamed protein product [Rhizophagus irregularis]|nr:unnamed protein product [Rhizophagus irregularis]